MTTNLAVDYLINQHLLDKDAEVGYRNPHWYMGVNQFGYWWSYICCDLCNDEGNTDFENTTADGLRERFKDFNDDEWEIIK